VTHGPVSRPYIDITLDTMASFGVAVERDGYERFGCRRADAMRGPSPGRIRLLPGRLFLGRRSGNRIDDHGARHPAIFVAGRHPDRRYSRAHGLPVGSQADGVSVAGSPLSGVEVDMGDIPDMVPTVAVAAAFAKGRTVIHNVAHLKEKESDRLAAVSTGLAQMGIRAGYDKGTLWVDGGQPQAAAIDCCNDHASP